MKCKRSCVQEQLRRKAEVKVDTEDQDLLALFPHVDLKGRCSKHIKGRTLRLHRCILERLLSRDLLPGEECDHVDGDVTNNRRNNLRLATSSQNKQNRKRIKNRYGFRGVCRDRRTDNWYAQIKVRGKHYGLGSYATAVEAAKAYDVVAYRTFKEFAVLNFPVEDIFPCHD